jgi:hypothetical protein
LFVLSPEKELPTMLHQEANAEKRLAGYRGVLIYRQEYGYKLLTMMIDLRTPSEQSYVVSRLGEIDLVEEAKQIPACLPLTAIDVYHFAVTDGTEIKLTIKNEGIMYTARYSVLPTEIEEHFSFLWLDIVASSESRRLLVQSTRER